MSADPGRPPIVRVSPARWAREHLFSSWYNTLFTLLFAALGTWLVYRATRFVLVSARWDIIRINIANLLVGRYPRDELWRVWAAGYLVAVGIGLAASTLADAPAAEDPDAGGPAAPDAPPARLRTRVAAVGRRVWPAVLLAGVVISAAPSWTAVAATAGMAASLAAAWQAGHRMGPRLRRRLVPVSVVACAVGAVGALSWAGGTGWDRWGGLLLTLFLATAGIIVSFPLGLLLALGRRSSFPALRLLSVTYIELIRGVPLITLLFMGAFAIGFLVPPGAGRPSLVTRGLIALVLFTAAYIAEIVRGGLQSVPKGQTEAGMALGLSPVRITTLIVLPQALRAVIPAIVGQFISLFKDTSLFTVIGLTEMLRIAQSLTSQPRFLAQGLHAEVLLFVSFVYWVGSYSMSRESRRLEERLGVGTR